MRLADELVRMVRRVGAKDLSDLAMLGHVVAMKLVLRLERLVAEVGRPQSSCLFFASLLDGFLREEVAEFIPALFLIGTGFVEFRDGGSVEHVWFDESEAIEACSVDVFTWSAGHQGEQCRAFVVILFEMGIAAEERAVAGVFDTEGGQVECGVALFTDT